MPDYAKRVASLRDEDLVEIAFSNERDGFDPVFVAVARKEVSRRKIDGPTRGYGAQLPGKNEFSAALNVARNEISLNWTGHLLLMLSSIFFVPCLIAISVLFFTGYTRKAKDAVSAMCLGSALWMVFFIIAGVVT